MAAATSTRAAWPAPSPALFARLDAFMARCHDAHAACLAAVHFSRLERAEIGGTRGGALTAAARQLHAEFAAATARLQGCGADPLDPGDPRFEAAYAAWGAAVAGLERRLGALLVQAMEASPTVEAASRLLESLEGVADRPAVAAQLEKCHVALVRAFAHEVRAVGEAFAAQKGRPPLGAGAPPFAGAVAWARGMRARLEEPMARLRALLPGGVAEGEDWLELARGFEAATNAMRRRVTVVCVEYGCRAKCRAA
jgi:dynein heavy chain